MVCSKHFLKVALGLLFPLASYASITDSIHTIGFVEVYSNRISQQLIGTSVENFDSTDLCAYQTESLTELLSSESVLTVHSYGPGGVANVSMRGGGAHHTSVIWNGLNIQSSMNGGVNLNTLPLSLIDEVSIQTGGSCTLFGSGTATGSVQLQNVLSFNSRLNGKVAISQGSAHNSVQQLKLGYGAAKSAFSVKLLNQKNKNDFWFRDERNNLRRLEHGGFTQQGGAIAFKARLNSSTYLGLDIWALNLDKNIAAIMSDTKKGTAHQIDRNLMHSLYLNSSAGLWNISARFGGIRNQIIYDNSGIQEIHNNNRSYTLVNSLLAKRNWTSGIGLNVMIEQKYERANSGSYDTLHERNTLSAVTGLSYTTGKNALFSISIRNELLDKTWIPYSFTTGAEIQLIRPLLLKFHVSKNYATPTFNALYWKRDAWSGGNPDLLPEAGWSFESGLFFSSKSGSWQKSASLIGFANYIDNWITWVESNNFWSPQNTEKGESKGIETSFKIEKTFARYKLFSTIRYSYISSKAKKAAENFIPTNRQRYYVPFHTANFTTGIEFNQLSFKYIHTFVSERTFDDLNGVLPAYTLGEIYSCYTIHFLKNYSIDINLKINNIWNTSYQGHRSYAMPLAQYQAGISLNF